MNHNKLKDDLPSECHTIQGHKGGKRQPIQEICAGKYTALGRIWIEGEDGALLGYGRVTLVEWIKRHGSITEAIKSTNISCRYVQELVDSMIRQSLTSLVKTATGGKGCDGATLAEAGE